MSWDTNFPTLIFINLALWTLFICALFTTEYFTQYENLADAANDLSKVLSNVQSTWLSCKLKVSVQGKVTDSQLFDFKTNTWKGVLVWDYGEWFRGLFMMK